MFLWYIFFITISGCPKLPSGPNLKYNNKCYAFSYAQKTWNESSLYCQSLAGDYDLVTISSEDEYNFLKGQVIRPMWIGLHDITYEGNYSWADGSLSNFGRDFNVIPWCPGEPNNWVFAIFKTIKVYFCILNHI